MIVVIGGIASGKKTWVRSLGYGEEEFSDSPDDPCPVIYNIQDSIFLGATDEDLLEQFAGKEVVICPEVGCGVVPASSEDREWRERVGRLTNKLANKADCVVRVVCGIPMALKGELPTRRGG